MGAMIAQALGASEGGLKCGRVRPRTSPWHDVIRSRVRQSLHRALRLRASRRGLRLIASEEIPEQRRVDLDTTVATMALTAKEVT
jgi:hypothetical protein